MSIANQVMPYRTRPSRPHNNHHHQHQQQNLPYARPPQKETRFPGGNAHRQNEKSRPPFVHKLKSPDPTKSDNPSMFDRDFPHCPDRRQKYMTIAKIGQGTFGEVFKAKNQETGQVVALKKILIEKDQASAGFPVTALREIKILNNLKRVPTDNIVQLIEICRTRFDPKEGRRPEIHLVFEFCDHDLAGLLQNKKVNFSMGEKKKLSYMLFEGLFALHKNKILHRDIKSANILITKKGVLKIADFGLARPFSYPKQGKENRYTNRVVTLWYRPPELLLGERNYGPAIDVWGAGCVMAELWTRTPLLQGSNEQDMLEKIQRFVGGINTESWPGVEKYPSFRNALQGKPITKEKSKIFKNLGRYLRDENGLKLVEQLLTLKPENRWDCDTVLDHDFFWTDPMPCSLEETLSKLHKSLFDFTESLPQQMKHAQHSAAKKPAFTGLVDRVF